MRELGHDAQAANVRNKPGDLDGYDGIVVGASIHMGEHEEHVRDFVGQHRKIRERAPSGFFSVSLTPRDHTEEAKAKMREYVERFVEETGWRPDMVGNFGRASLQSVWVH